MSDDRLRARERVWRESRTADDQARVVVERVRAGLIAPDALEAAAALGHAAACAALGREPGPLPSLDEPEEVEPGSEVEGRAAAVAPDAWLAKALERGPEACGRVAVAAARAGRYEWERFEGPDDRLLAGLDALEEWLREPGPAAVERASDAYTAITQAAQEPGRWIGGMGNAVLELLQVATEQPLAREHARDTVRYTLGTFGRRRDRPEVVFEAIRDELGEWLLGLSDPVADRLRVLGLRLGREPDMVRGVAFSPDGRHIASSSRAGTTTVWSVGLRRRVLDLPRQEGEVFGLAYTPDGRLLTGTSKGALRLWDGTTGALLREVLDAHPGGVRVLTVLDDQRAVVAGDDRRLVVWDLAALRPLAEVAGDTSERLVAAIARSPDARLVAVTAGPLVRLRAAHDLSLVAVLEGAHGSDVEDVRFTPDGRQLISAGGYDRSAKVWDLESRAVVATFEAGLPIRGLGITPDGLWATTGGEDELHLWSTRDGQRAHLWRWPGVLLAMDASSTEPLMVSGSRSGALRLWRP